MTIHLTGDISFQDLIDEFGVPKPISLSQMYSGGGYVPAGNAGVPTSGAISLGNFYGATGGFTVDYNVTADTLNLNSSTILANSGWDGVTPVTLTINISAGVVVSSNNTANPALSIQGGLPANSKIFVNNSGFIIGMGGNGGNGGAAGVVTGGGSGGTALKTLSNIVVSNTGTIGGGGGGGGGSGGSSRRSAGGGGGRSGKVDSNGGTGATQAGFKGTFTAAGAGGNSESGRGGNGGDWGTSGNSSVGAGGAGGAAVEGNSLINWLAEGIIAGSLLN